MPSKDFPNSSNLKRLEWEDGTLRATFLNGNTYVYEEVPERVFDAIEGGKGFHRLVRTKAYKFRKETPDADAP